MMPSLNDIVIKVSSDVKGALSGINKVNDAVDDMSDRAGGAASKIRGATAKIGKAFAAAGVAAGAAGVAGVAKATMQFGDFEQQVLNAASVTGQTGAEFEKTKKNIMEVSQALGSSTAFSASDAASAMYDLASAGMDVGNMVKTDLKPILDLAAGTQTDLTRTTEVMTSALGQFGLEASETDRVADVMGKTIGSSKATVEKLANSFKYVGPVANSLGYDIEDVSSALGQLYNAGFAGEQAGTAMRNAMSRLMTPTDPMISTLQKLGVEYDEVNPATQDFTDILQRLADAGITTKDAMNLFGQQAGPAMLSLIGNTEGIYSLEESLRSAGGTAEGMATQQLDGLNGAITILKSSLEGVILAVGEQFAPAMRVFAQSLTAAMPGIQAFITSGIEKLKGIASQLAPSWENVKSIASSLAGILGDLGEAFGMTGDSMGSLTGAINTVTSGLAKVFAWIDKHPTVTKLAATVVLAATAFSMLAPVVGAVIGIATTLGTVISTIITLFAAGGSAATVIGAAIAALGGPITIIIAAVALLAAAWATNLFGIRDKTYQAISFIKQKFNELRNLTSNARTWGRNIIQSFVNGIKSKISAVTRAVRRISDKVKDYIGFYSPSKKGAGKDADKWAPNLVKMFASGVEGNLWRVDNAFGKMSGPNGIPFNRTSASTANAPAQTNIYLQIRDPVVRQDSDIDRIVDRIDRKLARNINRVTV